MSQLQFLARRWGSAIPRRSVSSFFRATMHDQRGFTGAEKALLVCFGLAVVSGVGFLISEGGQKAAGDAKTTLTTQSRRHQHPPGRDHPGRLRHCRLERPAR